MIKIPLIHSCLHTKGHSAGCYLPGSKIHKALASAGTHDGWTTTEV